MSNYRGQYSKGLRGFSAKTGLASYDADRPTDVNPDVLAVTLGIKPTGDEENIAKRKAREYKAAKESGGVTVKGGNETIKDTGEMETHEDGDKWISKAIKHPGALTKKAHAAGESPMAFAHEHEGSSGKTGKQARLAVTLGKMHHDAEKTHESKKEKKMEKKHPEMEKEEGEM